MRKEVKISIAIVEPSDIIFEGLQLFLNKTNKQIQVSRFENICTLLEIVENEPFHILILNPYFAQAEKNQFHRLQQKCSNSHFVAIVYQYYPKEIIRLFDDKISITDDFTTFSSFIHKLVDSIANIHEGSTAEALSEREKEVLIHIASGLSNKEIADKLCISIHTVISHRKKITEKTGIKSRSGLTIYAISNKLISIEHSFYR